LEVLDDLISSLAQDSKALQAVVEEVYACAMWTAVRTIDWGLASSLRGNRSGHGRVREVGHLRGKRALELAEYAKSDYLLEASIGLATINSLISTPKDQLVSCNAFDILSEMGRGKKIAVVGRFPGTQQLASVAENLWVIEKRPRPGDLPSEFATEILPQADIIGLTATSLINHTFEELMSLCRGKFVVLVGPSSPLSPILFDYGVSVISGIRVIEPDRMLACVTEGATFKDIAGLKMVSLMK
jgi:uncharacterized protein (DUF4213/DUF364 family)